jgi:hypothetical protein
MHRTCSSCMAVGLLGVALTTPSCKGGATADTSAPSSSPASVNQAPTGTTATAAPSAPPASAAAPTPGAARVWNFDGDPVGGPPKGFSLGRTGRGRPGSWVVQADPTAPSGPNVLAQLDADTTDYRFPVAFAEEPSLRDLELKVRCKQVSGKVDRACGLIFRVRDADNYYLTRGNALEDNVCFYFVKGGRRQSVTCWNGTIESGVWHDYRVVARGDHFEVYWDGKKVIDHHDSTFPDAGKVGVWTKADTVTYFDDLSVSPLQ